MRSLAAIALLATACSGTAKTSETPGSKPAKPTDNPPVETPADTATTSPSRAPGVPHLTAIERIVLSPTGDAAITRDTAGRLRFWAALDGTAEPLPIPIGSASHFALAARSGAKRGWTIALVDTAGAAHLLFAHPNGVIERVTDLPPSLSVVDINVLPGGERIAMLRSDRVIELRDLRGKLLAKHDRRGFRPARLRIAGASTLIALELDPGTKESSIAIYKLAIEEKGGKLAIVEDGDGYEVTVKSFAVGTHQTGISPDAKHFAFVSVDKTSSWEAVIVDLEARQHRAVSMKSIPRHQTPALGFVGPNRLVVRGGANGASWILDVAADSQKPLGVRPDTRANAPRAFADDLLVAGLGNWLYVYRIKKRRALYLGYESFSPMTAAVSPSASAFAWGSGNDLFVSAPSGERLAHRELLRHQSVRHISFVDDRRILIAYYTAALELYDYKSGKVIDSADGGGSFSTGGYDPVRKLFYAVPQHGQVWVTRITSGGLDGPYVIADGAIRAGFLDGDNALWTVDNRNRLRFYTEAELRSGLSSDQTTSRGAILSVRPIGLGRDGRIFATAYHAGRNHLVAYSAPEMPEPEPNQDPLKGPRIDLKGNELARIPSVTGVNLTDVSPDGKRIAVVSNNVVFVRDDNLKVLWSYPFPNGVRALSWNASSTHLSIATQEAAVVFEAGSGRPISTDCGPIFSARAIPPANLFPPNVQASVCERR